MDEFLPAMIATDLSECFGRDRVFQLPVTNGRAADFYTRVPVLFDDAAIHGELLTRIEAGDEIAVASTPARQRERTEGADLRVRLRADGIPMFVPTPAKDLRVLAAGDRPPLEAGQELIGVGAADTFADDVAQTLSTRQMRARGQDGARCQLRVPGRPSTFRQHAHPTVSPQPESRGRPPALALTRLL